ncbi:MAG: hypothetical protein KF729_06400 [Sandaracinaceae bacterium]|nr:hypothetical protein [Sandaracinaceae bacterium]
MTTSLRLALLALLLGGCDTTRPPEGRPADAGSTAPEIDGGGWDLCRGRGQTRHPDPPSVPFCADGVTGAPRDWDLAPTGAPRAQATITRLTLTSIGLSTATGAVALPWLGPDPADYFELGEEVVLEVGGSSYEGWERVEGASSTALRVRFPWYATEVADAPLPLAYGVASCNRGGGSLCECGFGGYAWFEHAIVAGSVAIAPRATALVDGWSVTNVTAPRVVFFQTCEAGAVPGEAAVTFIRRR